MKSCILGNKEAILCAVEEMTYVFCKKKRDCAVGREDFVLSIKELMCYLGGKEEEIGWEVKVFYLKAFPSTALATIHQLDKEDRRTNSKCLRRKAIVFFFRQSNDWRPGSLGSMGLEVPRKRAATTKNARHIRILN